MSLNDHVIKDTRTHVVGELYDTERSYVESLQILVEVSEKFNLLMQTFERGNERTSELAD